MADQGPVVRVYREGGAGTKLNRKDAEAFIAANPGAYIAEERSLEDVPTAQEVAAGGHDESKAAPKGATKAQKAAAAKAEAEQGPAQE